MPTKKVTDLSVQSSVHDTDTYHVVNTTDTTQGPAGSSYKITWATFKAAILALLSAGTGILISGGVISSDPNATQTLTNKTLTAPVVNDGSINSATVVTPTVNIGSDATGDIHYRGVSGILARLGIGSVGQVLGVSSGVPAWIAPPQTPSGTVAMFAGASAPTNWLLCDGSAVSRTTYANLFAAIGTTFGSGNGTTTFNVPDLRGRVAVGKNGATFSTLGGTGGEETHLLITSEMPSHTHGLVYGVGAGVPNIQGYQLSSAANMAEVISDATGGGGAHNNLQPYLTLNYIIAT